MWDDNRYHELALKALSCVDTGGCLNASTMLWHTPFTWGTGGHNDLPQCINNALVFKGVQCNKLLENFDVELLAVK